MIMNWMIILIGNLLMDAGIALFAILEMLHSNYLSQYFRLHEEHGEDLYVLGEKYPPLGEQVDKIENRMSEYDPTNPIIFWSLFLIFLIGIILEICGIFTV